MTSAEEQRKETQRPRGIFDDMPYESLEQKGLGLKLGEIVTSIGKMDNHLKYATLIRDKANGKFNIQIHFNRMFKDSLLEESVALGMSIPEEVYLFREMVIEEEARRAYNNLK